MREFYSYTKLKFKIVLEEIFNVKVLKVNSMILPVKRRRLGKFEGSKNTYKRMYITLLRFLF
jgi:large subunit ribosomal protein L23